jgi:hypothetical protein
MAIYRQHCTHSATQLLIQLLAQAFWREHPSAVGTGPQPQLQASDLETADWPQLLQAAAFHGQTRHLYQELNHGQVAGQPLSHWVPPACQHQLQRYSQRSMLHMMQLIHELHRMLRLFQEHDIPAIPYKGPVLSLVAYGNLGIRQAGDLDILVAPETFARARELLLSQQYTPAKRNWQFLNAAEEERYIQLNGECAFFKGPICLDLHHRLTPKYLLQHQAGFAELWQRCERLQLAPPETLRSLGREDLMILLCIHGTKERWRSLKWILDVAKLAQSSPDLDWDLVLAQAAAQNCQRMVLLGLTLAHDFWGLALPDALTQVGDRILPPAQLQPLRQLIPRRLGQCSSTTSPVELAQVWSPLERWRFCLGMMTHWGDRLAYSTHLLKQALTPNSEDTSFIQLLQAWHWLYYLLRPIRLLKERFIQSS